MPGKIGLTGISFVVLFGAIQLIQPERTNPSGDPMMKIEADDELTPKVNAILERACVDCHSNQTKWPWYSRIAPISWLMVRHVNEGRKKLNLSEWLQQDDKVGRRRPSLNQMEEICDTVEKNQMPLRSYTLLHWNAELTLRDVKAICGWADRLAQGSESTIKGKNTN